MKKSAKLVFGIGIKGMDYETREGGKPSRVYTLWLNMLRRCTQKYWDKYPTYTGVSCSENFKSYTFFYEWCQEQVGFRNIDGIGARSIYHLDKDLLIKGNKVYSEYTCCFVPSRINKLFVKRNAKRGKFPIGVHYDKIGGRIIAAQSNGCGGKTKYLGSFDTPQEAFLAYKTFKEALIKEVANEYKEMLDSRVYEALMNYEVNEND